MTVTLILAAFIVLLAAFVRATSGFGYALLATPLLTFIFEPKMVVVMNVILATITHAMVLSSLRRHIDLRKFAFTALGGIFGIPLGALLLSGLEPSFIKLAIAILLIPFSLLLLLGHRHQFKRETPGCVFAGFIGGVLAASTSLGGPPVIIFFLNQGLTTERFVATLAAYFLLTGVFSIGAFSSLGMITPDLLLKVVLLSPGLFLGSYIGMKVLPKINPLLFRKIASSLVSVTALVIIVSTLTEL